MSQVKTLGLGTGDLKSNVRPKTIRKIPKTTGPSSVTIKKPSRMAEPRQTTSENRTARTTTTMTGMKKTTTRPVRPKKSAPVVSQESRPPVAPATLKGTCPSPPMSPRKLLINLSRAAGILPHASHGGDFLHCWNPQEEAYSSLRPVNPTPSRHFLKAKPPRNRIPKTPKFTLSPYDPVGLEDPIGVADTPVSPDIETKTSPARGNASPHQPGLEARHSRLEIPSFKTETPYVPRLTPLSEITLEPFSFPRSSQFKSRQVGNTTRDLSEQCTGPWFGDPIPAPRRLDKISSSTGFFSGKVQMPLQNANVSAPTQTAMQQENNYHTGVPSQDRKPHVHDLSCRLELRGQQESSQIMYQTHKQELALENIVAGSRVLSHYAPGEQDFSYQSLILTDESEFPDPVMHFPEQPETSTQTVYPSMEPPPRVNTTPRTSSSAENSQPAECDETFQELQSEAFKTVQQMISTREDLPPQEFCEPFQQPFPDGKHSHYGYNQTVQAQFPSRFLQQECCETVQQPFQTGVNPHCEYRETAQQLLLAGEELRPECCETAQQFLLAGEELCPEYCETAKQLLLAGEELPPECCETVQQSLPNKKEQPEKYDETAQQQYAGQKKQRYLESPAQEVNAGQILPTYCQTSEEVQIQTTQPFYAAPLIINEYPTRQQQQQQQQQHHYCRYPHEHPLQTRLPWNGDSGVPYSPPADGSNVICEATSMLSLRAVTSSPEDTSTDCEPEDQSDPNFKEGVAPITKTQNQQSIISAEHQYEGSDATSNGDSSKPDLLTFVKHTYCSCMNSYPCERQSQDVWLRSGHMWGSCYSGDNWYSCDHGKDEVLDHKASTAQFHVDSHLDMTRRHVCRNVGDRHQATCGLNSQNSPSWEGSRSGISVLQLGENKYHSTGKSITQMQSTWRLPECWRSSSHGNCKTPCQYRAGSSPQSLSMWQPENSKEAPLQTSRSPTKSESGTDCEDISLERDSQGATPHSITPSDFEHLVPPENDSPDTPNPRPPTSSAIPCASPCATSGSQHEWDKALKEDTEIGSGILVPDDTVQTAKGNNVVAGSFLKKATPFTMTLGQPETPPNTYVGDNATSLYVHGDEVVSVSDGDNENGDEPGDAGDSMDRASDISSASSAGISENEVTDFSASSNEPRMFVPTALSLRVTFANLPTLLCVVAVSLGSLLLYQNQTY